MSLSSILNSDQGDGEEPAPPNAIISRLLPVDRQETHDAFDFSSFLPIQMGDGPSDLSLDYAALDQLEGGVTQWGNAQGPEIDDSDSDQPDGSDVEMTSGAELVDSAAGDGSEVEMVDDTDQVCYGMLYSKDAVLKHQNMPSLVAILSDLAGTDPEHVQRFTLTHKPAPHILLSLPDGTQFGILRNDMTEALESLLKKSPTFELEAVAVTTRLREQIGLATKPNEAVVQVSINIYGPRDSATEVGDMLSDRKQWLQKPDFYKAHQYPYSNPHALHFPELESQIVEEEIRQDVSTIAKPRAEEERIKKLVAQVHGALSRAAELDIMEGDQRLKTNLLEHQQQALSYMFQRESGGVPEKFRLWQKDVYGGQEMYIHKITKTRSPVRPEEMGGGVLADEMGMGKTLSTLALVMQTLEAGQHWAEKKRAEVISSGKIQRHSRSTLVIVPSVLLINSWLKEIRTHTGETLKTVRYHGPGRSKDLDVLENSDLVITTYNTLSTEFASKKSLLHKIFWYRVVLDEAHIIRRPATTLYRTCADLEARSRWCLTGTPIQNRLEDIGALFAFLRAEPFHSLAQFRRFICIPFEQGEEVAKDRLILIYDSLCLRRTKDILNLPGHEEHTEKLTLTEDERRQYDKTANILNRYMRTQVGHYPGHGSYHGHHIDSWKASKFGMFQAHLQLRILCNHGTFQKPFSWKKRDAREERVAMHEALASEIGLRSEIMCDGCRQPRPILGSTQAENTFVENCQHSLCLECLEDCIDMHHCPLCQRFGKTDVEMRDGGDGAPGDEDNPHHRDYFNRTGYSTKMHQLMKDVKKDVDKKKSIIFSCWTRTLDLIARHLREERVVFLRVDGETLVSKRQGIIDSFASEDDVRVLLMTTGTGAFGLNLTAANRIFLIEPQWNPSVENQAIARAIRIQQKEKVEVTRYMIKDTVEQEMQTQQINKRLKAEIGFVRKEGEGNAASQPVESQEAMDSEPLFVS